MQFKKTFPISFKLNPNLLEISFSGYKNPIARINGQLNDGCYRVHYETTIFMHPPKIDHFLNTHE
jgi:hypothetical protein